MRSRSAVSVALFVALVAAAIGVTLGAGNRPLLGLDLQGGVSVVLEPTEAVDNEILDQTISIIRNRVDALGVAEPEIARQGGAILVQLPGVQDQDRALMLVGTTAELRFRPVIRELPPEDTALETLGIDPDDPASYGPLLGGQVEDPDALSPAERRALLEEVTGIAVPTTPPGEDLAEAVVVLAEYDRGTGEVLRRWEMGPTELTGAGLRGADAVYTPDRGWHVLAEFRSGDEGTNQLNALATACRNAAPSCPAARMGITLDSRVEFAGGIASASVPPFPTGEVSIFGDYSQRDAKDVELALRYGALPVQLEPQTTQTVSATLGTDARNAGILAGIVGLALVAAYMILYYRILGLVAIMSLGLSGALLWAIISYLGETQGLALTLAGIVGIIVAIGVSVDSNVVYYEQLKEDIANGRTPRSAADRSFGTAFRTVVKADLATLIGAAAIYLLTVGAVRGFAFYLGLATLLDLTATKFFLGPAVSMLARLRTFNAHPGRFGLPAGPRPQLAVSEVPG